LILASKKDTEVEKTRQVYWKSLVWTWNTDWISTVSIWTFDNMTSQQQDDYTNKMVKTYGKIKFQ
jgi:hypothetical protein